MIYSVDNWLSHFECRQDKLLYIWVLYLRFCSSSVEEFRYFPHQTEINKNKDVERLVAEHILSYLRQFDYLVKLALCFGCRIDDGLCTLRCVGSQSHR